jgi:hypothetical protein
VRVSILLRPTKKALACRTGPYMPLLESLGELREIPPGIDAVPFGTGSLLGAELMRSHFDVAVAMGPALRAGTKLSRTSTPDSETNRTKTL